MLVAGTNQLAFLAVDAPAVSFYSVANVRIEATGPGLGCGDEIPSDVIDHATPLGVSAFAALSPRFPAAELFAVLGGLARPFTAVLLDFGPVYERDGVQMFTTGEVGSRAANAAHLEALALFLERFAAATPGATERHVQLFLLNGPGVRRPGYARAYPFGPEDLDAAIRGDRAVQLELEAYVRELDEVVSEYRDRIRFRLALALEDNLTEAGATALSAIVAAGGWADPVGRNPCGCGFGDSARVGDFHENHLHSLGAIAALPGGLRPPDSFSNDGWGFAGGDATAAIARAEETGLWFHLWYDPAQGYPIPDSGPRNLRFDHAADTVIGWFASALGVDPRPDPDPGPTGDGVERSIYYRDATFEQRRNWVLDCRDYAYTARFDEHTECDGRYDPDRTTHGRAIFRFDDVIADRYEVWIEGRHTTNRNPAGMLAIVGGVERRIAQRDNDGLVWDLHGTHDLSGAVDVIIDSTRENGSDAVRTVRISPVR